MAHLDQQRTAEVLPIVPQFEIDPANNTDAVMARMYARLVAAYYTQQPIGVGYDNSGSCGTNGYIHVYVVG